jgi:Uma2 family endonuclease
MEIIANSISTPTQAELLLLNVSNTVLHVTPDEFDSLCLDNPDLRLELTKDKELIVMSPTGGESGRRNIDLTIQVGSWSKQTKLGQAFESSTGYDFIAIGGGKMSPDVSWIEKSRLDGVDITKFIPVVPDFVIELRSATDKLKTLQAKMLEYQRLGVKLGLLINPQDKQVEVYTISESAYHKGTKSFKTGVQGQLEQNTEVLNFPTEIDCNWLMPGFNLDLTEIF